MKFLSVLRVEAGKTLRSPYTWIAVLLTAVSPAAGVWLYKPLGSDSVNGEIIGNPTLAGALCGAIVFAVLAASAFHYKQRFRIEIIIDSILSPIPMAVAQTVSLLFVASIAQAATLAAWLPYSAVRIGDIFSVRLYLSLYLCIMFASICFSILFTASVYMVTRRFDLSLVLFAAFFMLSFILWENWLMRWVNPAVSYISDVFGNSRRIMSVNYNRLFWTAALAGFWTLSLACVRRYGKNLLGSVSHNMHLAYISDFIKSIFICRRGGVTDCAKTKRVRHSAQVHVGRDDPGAPHGIETSACRVVTPYKMTSSFARYAITFSFLRGLVIPPACGAGRGGRTMFVPTVDGNAFLRSLIPVISAILAYAAVFVYVAQPFLDNSLELIDYFSASYAYSDSESVTCDRIYVNAKPNLSDGSFRATAIYYLQNAGGTARTVAFNINPGYKITTALANGKPAVYRDLMDDERNEKTVEVDLPPDEVIELVLAYGGFPREWNILELNQGELEINRDYIYLANQDFSPYSNDIYFDRNSSVYTADIALPEGMTPVLFGIGTAEILDAGSAGVADSTVKAGMVRWRLNNHSDRIILYVGDYTSRHIEAAAMDVEFYYSKKHDRAMADFNVDSVIKDVFEYCARHIGPLSFMKGGTLRLIEIGMDGGGYAGAGCSAMGESSFSQQSLSDHLRGAGGDEVLAHEIIHQWWGVGNMFDASSEDNAWSSEGLTVYTTYRMMKALYGEEYASKNYVDVWRRESDNYHNNFYVRNPIYFNALPKTYQADISNGYTHLRRYCEMPLMLLKAEGLLGGEEAFDRILNEIFTREYNEDYSNVFLSYDLFLEYCGLTEEDLRLE